MTNVTGSTLPEPIVPIVVAAGGTSRGPTVAFTTVTTFESITTRGKLLLASWRRPCLYGRRCRVNTPSMIQSQSFIAHDLWTTCLTSPTVRCRLVVEVEKSSRRVASYL
jgi:hypothetical protein